MSRTFQSRPVVQPTTRSRRNAHCDPATATAKTSNQTALSLSGRTTHTVGVTGKSLSPSQNGNINQSGSVGRLRQSNVKQSAKQSPWKTPGNRLSSDHVRNNQVSAPVPVVPARKSSPSRSGHGQTQRQKRSSGMYSNLNGRQGGAVGGGDQPGSLPTAQGTEGSNGAQSDGCENRMRPGAGQYTVVSPIERKRREIAEQAKREEEALSQYKEQNRLTHVSCGGAVGGGATSEEAARVKAQREQRNSKANARKKAEEYRLARRREEDAELDKKKAVQRRKAEENKAREEFQVREEHIKVNEQFLSRLERLSTQDRAATQPTQGRGQHHYGDQLSDDYAKDSTRRGRGRHGDDDLDTLLIQYPHFDREALRDLLHNMNGDVSMVKALILDA